MSDIRDAAGGTADTLITTNLDNDDALATDFVARVQAAAATTGVRTAIYLADGLIASDGGVYHRVELTREVHRRAEHLLLIHQDASLRAADALHLALATSARAASLATFDARLATAARAVGLAVYPA